MKNRNLIIGVVIAAVVLAGLAIVMRPGRGKKAAPEASAPSVQKALKASAAPAAKLPPAPKKPAITKGMGALTVKLVNSKDKEVSARVRAFKVVDGKSSLYAATFITNRMQELAPGAYDIEVETSPSKLYRDVNVPKDRDAVEDLGKVTGSVEVKAIGGNKKPAAFPVRILRAKTTLPVASTAANRPVDVVAGVYDIEIGSAPRQVRKDVRVDAGKDMIIDIGSAGSLAVKAADDTGKAVRLGVKVKDPVNGEVAALGASNKPLDLMPGVYIVEIAATPAQTKSDVKVAAGEEAVIEIVVPAPPPPAPKPAAAPAKPAPVKK